MLSVILPTYNEAKNLPELLPKIHDALIDIDHEIIVVDDDSPDRTWEVARTLSREIPAVRSIRRISRSGLSSAVIEGFLAAKGDVLAVMDADGQHDEQLLVLLHKAVESGSAIAIGSRYVDGGSVGQWDERRYALSRMATSLAQKLCKVRTADPMSGFFAIHRQTFESVLPKLNPMGFKILLDLLVHIPEGTGVTEVPFTFGDRMHGESKLSKRVQLEFLEYLYDVTIGRCIPLLFVKYCIVGALGVLVHLLAFFTFFAFLGESHQLFSLSTPVLIAIETSIIFNFWLNNQWTFARFKLRGLQAIKGILTYNFACVFGALANYSIFAYLSKDLGLSSIVGTTTGAAIGAVWNYTMSRMLTWKT